MTDVEGALDEEERLTSLDASYRAATHRQRHDLGRHDPQGTAVCARRRRRKVWRFTSSTDENLAVLLEIFTDHGVGAQVYA